MPLWWMPAAWIARAGGVRALGVDSWRVDARSPGAAAEKGSLAVSVPADKMRFAQLKVTVGRTRGRFGLSAGYQSHSFGATTFQLGQHKPRQTWHQDVSLETARLRLGGGRASTCRCGMADEDP